MERTRAIVVFVLYSLLVLYYEWRIYKARKKIKDLERALQKQTDVRVQQQQVQISLEGTTAANTVGKNEPTVTLREIQDAVSDISRLRDLVLAPPPLPPLPRLPSLQRLPPLPPMLIQRRPMPPIQWRTDIFAEIRPDVTSPNPGATKVSVPTRKMDDVPKEPSKSWHRRIVDDEDGS